MFEPGLVLRAEEGAPDGGLRKTRRPQATGAQGDDEHELFYK